MTASELKFAEGLMRKVARHQLTITQALALVVEYSSRIRKGMVTGDTIEEAMR